MAKRVLIVEDDADLRGMFRHALIIAGFDVTEAGDGLTALRLIDSNPPDVVVLDLGLPILSGHAVRREIATQPHTKNISIVVVTGRSGDHRDLAVTTVLRKPIGPDQLVEEVRKCASSAPATNGG